MIRRTRYIIRMSHQVRDLWHGSEDGERVAYVIATQPIVERQDVPISGQERRSGGFSRSPPRCSAPRTLDVTFICRMIPVFEVRDRAAFSIEERAGVLNAGAVARAWPGEGQTLRTNLWARNTLVRV